MSRTAKNASEQIFQDKFVKKLQAYKWDAPDFLNGNKRKVTVDDLINHWREELNRINADQLEGVPLTDQEFKQVIAKVNQLENSFEAAKLLAMEASKGKIDGIYRDPNPRITREQITLTIFKKAEVSGGDSSYKIAREVESEKGNRFDLILLINGLPLINIEQKRSDKTLDEAFRQFKRYYQDGEYTHNFLAFSQMMVMTSEVATRYFATPKTIHDFNESFVFHWADKDNIPVNNWEDVISQFLMIPMAHQMVGDYLVIDEALEEENRRHMLMRPYQVHALQAVEAAAFGWDNADRTPHGGFVWHTTGSGKTITSFKTALFLSTRGGFDKVVFLVDRKELDRRTSENFKAYAAYEPVTVDDTQHTYQLRKIMKSPHRGIVVTTTYKLSNLVKQLEEIQDSSLADKKIVFIIDEAHRTTMGEMMGIIKSHFKKNGLFFGFTGTPLFEENKTPGMINRKSEVIDTTEKLFGRELHKYTIDEAISDGNVLGFHVDYMNTGEFRSYEDLREQIMEDEKVKHPDKLDKEIERTVYSWTELEVEKEASKRSILTYHDETHIPRVVEEIIENWDSQSQGRKFNAILTVAYKKRVLAYFEEFKKQLANHDNPLHIAMTFSIGSDEDPEPVDSKVVEDMFKNYASFTGIEFVAGDQKKGQEAYFDDLIARATRGGSGRNPKNIDLVIVANQLLTGYDSQLLNTLYVDRSLELQGLVQAYSRTNRVHGPDKEFGSIINFQYPRITEERVDSALKLYGTGGTSSKAIVEHYDTAVEKLHITIEELKSTMSDPTAWQEIKDDDEKKERFLLNFKDAANQMKTVEQYYQFEWNNEAFGIDEGEWLNYVGAYRNLTRGEGVEDDFIPPIPTSLPGKTKLAGTQIIDANHILELIGEKATSSNGKQEVDAETLRIIYQQIEELSNLGNHEKAELLKEFVVEELEPGHVPTNIRFDEAFENWKNDKKKKVIYELSQEWGLDSYIFEKSVDVYSSRKPEEIPYIADLTSTLDFTAATNPMGENQLEHNIKLTNELPKVIPEIKGKYD
ncbi:type I restriction endonuclease subunit R [Cerasibacillus terrae]|uniref:Type I restriction enzyme endonuclease subunit n=1 Tax=Cerasibacillus terrae TaxID=2498845 RepID=A0A5C8NG97_9BACI|nr:HsdR family type I site-specific deoxyribonuclease [Cerasibacillus terrae]TXL57568.1 type I restriction endonuclease subunit R [Cerasibacillus terrae]